MEPRRAGIPAKKYTNRSKILDRGGRKNEVIKEEARRKAEKSAVFKGKFFPHFRDCGVKKGLMLSSFPDAKNSSKM